MSEELERAVGRFVGAATAAFTASRDHERIKTATTKIRDLLLEWRAASETVQRALGGLLDTIQAGCDHKGAQRGYNERDGSWMNPCPHCGRSE